MHPQHLAPYWSVTTPLRPLDFDMTRGQFSRETVQQLEEDRKREGWIVVDSEDVNGMNSSEQSIEMPYMIII